MHKFRELKVWQRGMDFVTGIYRISSGFPRDEQFGMINQIRRAAISIPLNIVEGAGAGSDKEFQRFLSFALRSTYEVMSALEIAERLGYCTAEHVKYFLDEVNRRNGLVLR